jgi:8-oxo-dGTP diphosphatase
VILAIAFAAVLIFVLDTLGPDPYIHPMAENGRYVYDWPRPMVTVDIIVFAFDSGRWNVLLIKRRHEPFKNQWAIPGGFIGIDEELEDAAVRELHEETNLTGIKLRQLRTFGKCGRDPRGRQITIVFTGIADKAAAEVKAGDDAAEARWFDIERLPENPAFDHGEVLGYAIAELKREKSRRSGIGA